MLADCCLALRSLRVEPGAPRAVRRGSAHPSVLATRYATVRAGLDRRGGPTTDLGLTVARTALEHNATLTTNDGGLKAGAIDGLGG